MSFTKEEIERLPRWAQVAFAARCARSAIPRRAIIGARGQIALNAVLAAEQYSQGDFSELALIPDYEVARTSISLKSIGVPNFFKAAACAAEAAEAALKATDATAKATEAVISAVRFYTVESSRRDYEKLLATATSENWTDDTFVPKGFFKMSESPPSTEGEDIGEVRLELSFPADATDAEIQQRSLAWVLALNQRYKSLGGKGLRIDDLTIKSPVPCEVGGPNE